MALEQLDERLPAVLRPQLDGVVVLPERVVRVLFAPFAIQPQAFAAVLVLVGDLAGGLEARRGGLAGQQVRADRLGARQVAHAVRLAHLLQQHHLFVVRQQVHRHAVSLVRGQQQGAVAAARAHVVLEPRGVDLLHRREVGVAHDQRAEPAVVAADGLAVAHGLRARAERERQSEVEQPVRHLQVELEEPDAEAAFTGPAHLGVRRGAVVGDAGGDLALLDVHAGVCQQR